MQLSRGDKAQFVFGESFVNLEHVEMQHMHIRDYSWSCPDALARRFAESFD